MQQQILWQSVVSPVSLKCCLISTHRAFAPALIDSVCLFLIVWLSLCSPQILCLGQKAHLGDSHTGLESQIG